MHAGPGRDTKRQMKSLNQSYIRMSPHETKRKLAEVSELLSGDEQRSKGERDQKKRFVGLK